LDCNSQFIILSPPSFQRGSCRVKTARFVLSCHSVVTSLSEITLYLDVDEKLEDALEMLDLEWSKDDNTKMQCNRLNE